MISIITKAVKSIKSSEYIWILSRSIALFSLIFGSYIILYSFTSLNTRNRLTAVGVIASSILIFALLVIYKDMREVQESQSDKMGDQNSMQKRLTDIQEKQTEIMEKQEELMEYEHLPELVVESWRVESGKSKGKDIQSIPTDIIYIRLSNIGEGPVQNLRYGLYVTNPDRWDDGTEIWETVKSEGLTSALLRSSGYGSDSGNFIHPGEEGVRFQGPALTPAEGEYGGFRHFPDKVSELIDGKGVVSIIFYLNYQDRVGNEYNELIYCIDVDVDESMGFMEAIEKDWEKLYNPTNNWISPQNRN